VVKTQLNKSCRLLPFNEISISFDTKQCAHSPTAMVLAQVLFSNLFRGVPGSPSPRDRRFCNEGGLDNYNCVT